MSDDRLLRIRALFDESIGAHARAREATADAVLAVVEAMRESIGSGGKILVFGNGGSAADAQHLAAELVGRFVRERRALAAIALTTDTSVLTAIANDYGYERIFARQIEALARPGDLVIGITTSGSSANVVAAFEASRALGLMNVVLTGQDGGPATRLADIVVKVPDRSVARVQEVHRTILHAICELFERDL